jgi:hypothetical protein
MMLIKCGLYQEYKDGLTLKYLYQIHHIKEIKMFT